MGCGGKNNAIEFYRFFCTLIICIHHSRRFIGNLNWLKHGYICVEFFFILSGILLYKSFSKERVHSTLTYVKKRFIRLWPEYAFAAIIEIIVGWVCLHDFNLSKAVNELMMVQNTGLFRLGGYNYPCWYIPIMLFCGIIIYGLLTMYKETFRKLLAPIIIMCGYTYIWGLDTGLENWKYINFISVPVIRGICAMSIGVLIAILLERGVQEYINIYFGTLIEVICILLIGIGLITDVSTDMLTIVVFAMLLFITFGEKSNISGIYLNKNVWVKLSKYAYSIYLNHAIIIYGLSLIDNHILALPNSVKPILTFASIGLYAFFAKQFTDKLWGSLSKKFIIKNI